MRPANWTTTEHHDRIAASLLGRTPEVPSGGPARRRLHDAPTLASAPSNGIILPGRTSSSVQMAEDTTGVPHPEVLASHQRGAAPR